MKGISDNDYAVSLACEHGPCSCPDYELCGEGDEASCPLCRALPFDWPCPADPDAEYDEHLYRLGGTR